MNFYSVSKVAADSGRSRNGLYTLCLKNNLGCRCGDTIIFTEQMRVVLIAAGKGPLNYPTIKKLDECEKVKLYSAEEVAERFGVQQQTVYTWVRDKKYGQKAGIHSVFTEADVEKLEEKYGGK